MRALELGLMESANLTLVLSSEEVQALHAYRPALRLALVANLQQGDLKPAGLPCKRRSGVLLVGACARLAATCAAGQRLPSSSSSLNRGRCARPVGRDSMAAASRPSRRQRGPPPQLPGCRAHGAAHDAAALPPPSSCLPTGNMDHLPNFQAAECMVLDLLPMMLAQLPEEHRATFRVHLVGPGTVPEWFAEAVANRSEHVTFHGHLPEEQVRGIVCECVWRGGRGHRDRAGTALVCSAWHAGSFGGEGGQALCGTD